MKTRILAIAAIGLMLGCALVPAASANEECGSNDPLTFEKNRLYLNVKAGDTSMPFMSIEPTDTDGTKDTYGPTTQGVLTSNLPSDVPVFGGYSDIDFMYMPSTEYSIEFDSLKDATANIEVIGRQVDVPLVPAPLPTSIPGSEPLVMGSINFAVSVMYGDKELVRQEFSQQQIAGGQSFFINITFKMPGDSLTFGNETGLLFRFTNMGGYSTGSYGIVVKGKSYLELPVKEPIKAADESALPAGESITADQTNATYGPDESSSSQAATDETNKKTSGFEIVGLACAVVVAAFVIRRKH